MNERKEGRKKEMSMGKHVLAKQTVMLIMVARDEII